MGQPAWVWPAYYLVSAYFVVTGLAGVITTATTMKSGPEGSSFISYFVIIISAITALIGVGLAAKVDFVRGIVNIFCWLRILAGAFGAASLFLAGLVLGPYAILMAFWNLADAATAGLMIFLIGETD